MPVTILSREGVTQGDPLPMVLYQITLTPLAKELKVADSGLLYPFFADNAAFDNLARRSAQLLKLSMKRRMDQDISLSRISTYSSWTHWVRRRRRKGDLLRRV